MHKGVDFWTVEIAFILAVLLATGYVIFAEILPVVQGAGRTAGFPWGLISVELLLVAPKVLGKAAAANLINTILRRGNSAKIRQTQPGRTGDGRSAPSISSEAGGRDV